uniref:Uncharacterized protein n=1 Tax=Zooxanthella nutricula TaxID=1333877 RepID=A0A7S2PQD5_9DINO
MGSVPNLNALSQYKYPRRIKFESKPVYKTGQPAPGPKYELVDTDKTKHKRAPMISMASATRPNIDASTGAPGPGQYGVAGPSCIQSGKGFGFSQQTRLPKTRVVQAPGPGAYDIPSRLGGVEVAITCAPKGDVKIQGPGPGQYQPKFTQLELAAPAVSFTSSGFGKLPESKVPGPGKYDSPTTLGGNATLKKVPSYTFTSASTALGLKKDASSPSLCGQPTALTIPGM